jgi:hypothetical protein
MRSLKNILLLLLVGCFFLGTVSSCKKDSNPTTSNPDKTALKAMIDSLTAVSAAAVEGNKAGQYVPGAKEALDSVISLGNAVYTATNYSQLQVNNALNNLTRAGTVFSTKLLQEVSKETLVGYWKFNGNADDSSGRGNNGILKTNWSGASGAAVDGGTLPQLVPDRFGQANSAYYFNKGATIEVPYVSDLNPKSMTISLWIKTDVISNGGDYMFAMRRWNGYKLNLQTSNFLYFTVFGQDQSYFMDDDGGSNSAVALSTWVHAAVSYDNANSVAKFYLNGVLVKTDPDKVGPPITLATPYNITIGNELPKSKYNVTDSSDPDYYWGPDYFIGTLDDIRFYNSALSDNDILSIYTEEKTP